VQRCREQELNRKKSLEEARKQFEADRLRDRKYMQSIRAKHHKKLRESSDEMKKQNASALQMMKELD